MSRKRAVVLVALCLVGLATAAGAYDSIDAAGGFDDESGPLESADGDRNAGGGPTTESGGGGFGVVVPVFLPDAGAEALASARSGSHGIGVPPVLALGGIAALGLLAAAYRASTGAEAEPPADDTEPVSAEETRADPPDRCPEPSTEVYRAWWTLARRLERSRHHTPGDVARRAVARGLDREAVDELTGLFRSVRYGPADPTEEIERRAAELSDRLADREDEQ